MVKHARHTYPHESTEGDSVTARTYGICLRLVVIAGAVRRFDEGKVIKKVIISKYQKGVYFELFLKFFSNQKDTCEKKPPRMGRFFKLAIGFLGGEAKGQTLNTRILFLLL
jgi:hypothetical protein